MQLRDALFKYILCWRIVTKYMLLIHYVHHSDLVGEVSARTEEKLSNLYVIYDVQCIYIVNNKLIIHNTVFYIPVCNNNCDSRT